MSWVGDVMAGWPPWLVLAAVLGGGLLAYWAGPWAWIGAAAGWIWALVDFPGWGPALGIGGGLAGWLANCVRHPRAKCLACRGKAKLYGADGAVFHNCAICGGSGQRKRFGARVLKRHRPDDD